MAWSTVFLFFAFVFFGIVFLPWHMLPDKMFRIFGSKKLKHYEQSALACWKASLSSQELQTFELQMKQLQIVQRDEPKTLFFYRNEETLPLFGDKSTNNHVATVVFDPPFSGPAGPIKAKLYLQEGRFFSIEFPKRPKRMAEMRGFKVDQLVAKRLSYRKPLG